VNRLLNRARKKIKERTGECDICTAPSTKLTTITISGEKKRVCQICISDQMIDWKRCVNCGEFFEPWSREDLAETTEMKINPLRCYKCNRPFCKRCDKQYTPKWPTAIGGYCQNCQR